MDNLYEEVCKDSLYCSDHKHIITLSDIDNAMKKMKRGKGDGYDGLTSDFLINGTETLFYYISVLFSCMLTHCCIPDSFSMSTMVPIRDAGSMTDVKLYRGIALSSLFVNYLLRVLFLSIMKIFIPTVCNLLTNLILQPFNASLQ